MYYKYRKNFTSYPGKLVLVICSMYKYRPNENPNINKAIKLEEIIIFVVSASFGEHIVSVFANDK